VIEILSDSTRRLDEVLKRQAYERFGAREYWIFDPNRKGVQIWEQADESLRRRAFLSATGDVITTPLLTGLEIPLAEVFEG
jgi:Uma2 family endonuclease